MTTTEQQAIMRKIFEMMMATGHFNNQDQMAKELKAIHFLLGTRFGLSADECDNCLLFFFREYSLGCATPLTDSVIRANMIPTVKNYHAMDLEAGKELLLSAQMFTNGTSSIENKKGSEQPNAPQATSPSSRYMTERNEEREAVKRSRAEKDEAISIIYKIFTLAYLSGAIWLGFFLICALIINGPMEDVPGLLVLPAILLAFVFLKKTGSWDEMS